MHALEIVQLISLTVMLAGIVALCAVADRRILDQEQAIQAEASAPAPFHAPKGHKRPCADVGKAVVAYRYMGEGRTMQQVAAYYGMDISRLQKLLDKHGRTARRAMEAMA